MGNLTRHTITELDYARIDSKSHFANQLIKMVSIHEVEHHSGSSHGFTIAKFKDFAEEMFRCDDNKGQKLFIVHNVEEKLKQYDLTNAFDRIILLENIELLEVLINYSDNINKQRELFDYFIKAVNFRPLTPLTGEDWEWGDALETFYGETLYQNARYSSVFKNENGESYNIDAIVFHEYDSDNEYCNSYTGNEFYINGKSYSSTQNITFPYEPETFGVDVIKNEHNDDYSFINPNEAELTFSKFN